MSTVSWKVFASLVLVTGAVCYLYMVTDASGIHYTSATVLEYRSQTQRENSSLRADQGMKRRSPDDEEFMNLAERRFKERAAHLRNVCRMLEKSECEIKGKIVNSGALFSNNYKTQRENSSLRADQGVKRRSPDEEEFMNLAERRFKERAAHLRNVCRMLEKSECEKKGKTVNSGALFSNNYKFAVCPINKVGSSSWLRALSVMDDLFTVDEYKQGKIFGDAVIHDVYGRRGLATVGEDSEERALWIWDKYLKIITVRNPLHRIASAYNGKMRPGSSGFTTLYAAASRLINRHYRHMRVGAARGGDNDTAATFEDFVNFLLHHRAYPIWDPHWTAYARACRPCRFEYDVIVKFETFEDDVRYLERKLNVSERHLPAFFPARRPWTDDEKVERMFESVPKDSALMLYEKFEPDFLMFGYEIPRWLADKRCPQSSVAGRVG